MPKLSLCPVGHPISLPPIEKSGSYYVSALALTELARETSIEVQIGEVGLLKAETDLFIWTAHLQSCFPAVFKFKNGDIGLYHGLDSSIAPLTDFLARNDLTDIQLFEKGTPGNSKKVDAFAKNLVLYFGRDPKDNPPEINIKVQARPENYKVAVCYKLPNGEPVVLIGISGADGMAKDLNECSTIESITACRFESATTKFGLATAKSGAANVFKSPIGRLTVVHSTPPSFFKPMAALDKENLHMDFNAAHELSAAAAGVIDPTNFIRG